MQETQKMRDQSVGREDPLEEEMATHSSILAWKSPWMGYSPWAHEEWDVTEQVNNNNQRVRRKKEPAKGIKPDGDCVCVRVWYFNRNQNEIREKSLRFPGGRPVGRGEGPEVEWAWDVQE